MKHSSLSKFAILGLCISLYCMTYKLYKFGGETFEWIPEPVHPKQKGFIIFDIFLQYYFNINIH